MLARIDNKLLFFTTSPRTPAKMIPEIRLLHEKFSSLPWNTSTQEQNQSRSKSIGVY